LAFLVHGAAFGTGEGSRISSYIKNTMQTPFLDAGGAFLFEYVVLAFLAVATLAEAVVMILMKFNNAAKCFLDAFIVNLASLLAGYALLRFMQKSDGREEYTGQTLELVVMFLVTIIIEGLLLMLLNKKKKPGETWLVTFTMNVVSYALLLVFRSL
jgi:hypothetical protein